MEPTLRRILAVHYDEIAIKGGAREFFEKRLISCLRESIPADRKIEVNRLFGRLVLRIHDEGPLQEVARALANTPGVATILEGVETSDDFGEILAAVGSLIPDAGVASFGVRARRSDKSYPKTSEEIGREVGAYVLDRRAWKVDLRNPDLWIHIELVNRKALIGIRKHQGPGGLPTGGSGRGVALLSGGIDSPVAAWMMMTRGLRLTLVHFHSAPFTSAASQEKVRDLARRLALFQPVIRLVMVPFADPIQKTIVDACDARLRVLLYRRFMLRIADRAARNFKGGGIVTGEALGQVASQTLSNIASVGSIATLPLFRPLIGMGKRQIVETAKRIGTYEISIRPHDDCCTYLMPRHPATHSTAVELDAAEASLDVSDLVRRSYEARTEEVIRLKEQPAG